MILKVYSDLQAGGHGFDMPRKRKSLNRFIKIAIVCIVILGVLLAFANYREMRRHMQSINPVFIAAAGLCSLFVYLCEGIFLQRVLKVFHQRISLASSIRYSFIISALGYFISLGGITPFATQMHVLDFSNIDFKTSALSRALQVLFYNIVFTVLLITGFLLLLRGDNYSGLNISILSVLFGFYLIINSGFYLSIFRKRFRNRLVDFTLHFTNRILRFFTKKVYLSKDLLIGILDDFYLGVRNLTKSRYTLVSFIFLTFLIWAAWIMVMYLSFLCINVRVLPAPLIVGFSFGQIGGFLSMVPGGVGTLEGSSSLVFSMLGLSFESALIAVLIYRMMFNVVPFIFSIPFYFSLRKREQR
jgi:uncharacterized protein (TIRG00374 family)